MDHNRSSPALPLLKNQRGSKRQPTQPPPPITADVANNIACFAEARIRAKAIKILIDQQSENLRRLGRDDFIIVSARDDCLQQQVQILYWD